MSQKELKVTDIIKEVHLIFLAKKKMINISSSAQIKETFSQIQLQIICGDKRQEVGNFKLLG